MKEASILIFILVIIVASTMISLRPKTTAQVINSPPYPPNNPNTILFLGDSITEDGRYVNLVKKEVPNYTVINSGLSGETAAGLSEPEVWPRPYVFDRLPTVLKNATPETMFVCYGMNDGLYLPFDDGRFEKFERGITALHNEAIKRNIRVIHLTPPPFEKNQIPMGSPEYLEYDSVLKIYSDWLLSKKAEGWEVIDIRSPLKNANNTITHDGIHPNDLGHQLIAREIIKYINGST